MDYVQLEKAGAFKDHNEGAKWLQEHKNDPYWMAHELCEPFGRYDFFLEAWKMAREIKGVIPLSE